MKKENSIVEYIVLALIVCLFVIAICAAAGWFQ